MHDDKVDIVQELYKAKMKKRYGGKNTTIMKERFLKTANQRNMKKAQPESTDKSKETRLCKYV